MVLLASVVESFLREHSNCHVWIVAHRRELVSQIRETIERVFSKITPSLFVDKASCTRQFESELSLHSLASLFPIKEGSTSHPDPLQWSLHPLRFPRFRGTETSGEREETALQCYICPTCPSPAGGSLTHSQALALSKRARDVTALRCSEPLRSKVGGPSKVFAMLCGMGPPYYSLQR